MRTSCWAVSQYISYSPSTAIVLLHIEQNALLSNSITEEFTLPWITVQASTSAQLLLLPSSASVSPYTGVDAESTLLLVLVCSFQEKPCFQWEQECRSALRKQGKWGLGANFASLALRTPALLGPGTQITLSRKWWSRCEDFPWW